MKLATHSRTATAGRPPPSAAELGVRAKNDAFRDVSSIEALFYSAPFSHPPWARMRPTVQYFDQGMSSSRLARPHLPTASMISSTLSRATSITPSHPVTRQIRQRQPHPRPLIDPHCGAATPILSGSGSHECWQSGPPGCYAHSMAMLPPTTDALLLDDHRPYFLWWTDLDVAGFREQLRSADRQLRSYYLGALLREANSRDVWLFTTPDEIRAMWPDLARHLGKAQAMWAWLLDMPAQQWPPVEARCG